MSTTDLEPLVLAFGNRAFEAGAVSEFDSTDKPSFERYEKAWLRMEAAREELMAALRSLKEPTP